MPLNARLSLALVPLLAACAAPSPAARRAVTVPPGVSSTGPSGSPDLPDYASRPDEPFSRLNAVAIALREWRAFGQQVDDNPPDTRPDLGEARPDRQPGLWQRVGDYWHTGQDVGARVQDWTSKYDGSGTEFPPGDEPHAWSAAFVSYVMRVAGARWRFPYAPVHSAYIDAAVQGGFALEAHRLEDYAPLPGDLVCMGRGWAAKLRFSDLPREVFPSHCDMVVATAPGQDTVIGGNVDGAVTLRHIPVTNDGKLAMPDGTVLDTRWPWFVAIKVLYDQ